MPTSNQSATRSGERNIANQRRDDYAGQHLCGQLRQPGAVITFSPGIAGLEGCSNTAGNAVWIEFASTTQPDGKALYASVMAATLAGKVVTFGVAGCADANQLPLVYRVDVNP